MGVKLKNVKDCKYVAFANNSLGEGWFFKTYAEAKKESLKWFKNELIKEIYIAELTNIRRIQQTILTSEVR